MILIARIIFKNKNDNSSNFWEPRFEHFKLCGYGFCNRLILSHFLHILTEVGTFKPKINFVFNFQVTWKKTWTLKCSEQHNLYKSRCSATISSTHILSNSLHILKEWGGLKQQSIFFLNFQIIWKKS